MKKSIIGVLGMGEIGTAVASIFDKKYKVLKKDLNFDEIKNNKLEVLHVCIPYNAKFQSVVLSQIRKNNPTLVIIHSTIKPGTVHEIFNKTRALIVHSPVMGTHPNLKQDILKFTKFIGPVNKKAATLAAKHLKSVGIKTVVLNNSFESELGKLLDTTYYAWNIVFNKIVASLCKDLGADFNNIYTKFNTIYNQGYKSSKPNVTRPVLKFQEGPIGGHCLIPNAEILDEFIKSPLTKFLLEFNSRLKDH